MIRTWHFWIHGRYQKRAQQKKQGELSWGAPKDAEEFAPLAKSHTFSPGHGPYFSVWDDNYFLEPRWTFLLTKLHFIPWRSIADKQNIGISFSSQKQFAEIAKEEDNQANLKEFFLKES